MFIVFIVGTAGSGKSLLTASFYEWLRIDRQKVATLNLDPGAMTLPYTPDIDVRNYIRVEDIMDRYGLGPNGALIMAADLIADEASRIGMELSELNPDIVLVDTPGQMELFAFRASGPYIAKELTESPKAIVYLFDSVFSTDPLNYVSNMFLSAAIHTRFFLPQVHVLSKCDLLPKAEVDRILSWAEDVSELEAAIDERLKGTRRLLSQGMSQAICQIGLNFELIQVSAMRNEGMANLSASLERIFTGGEKFTY